MLKRKNKAKNKTSQEQLSKEQAAKKQAAQERLKREQAAKEMAKHMKRLRVKMPVKTTKKVEVKINLNKLISKILVYGLIIFLFLPSILTISSSSTLFF